MNKRIFISGGAGVIGTALVNALLAQGAELLVADLKPCPKAWQGKLRYWQGDLNEITAPELLGFDPEIFFHLAATFERSEESFPFFEENFHHNIHLSHHLIEILKSAASLQKVVFASSYLVYDPALYQSKDPTEMVQSLKEDSQLKPRNLCGGAKLYHEEELSFLSYFRAPQTRFISARIFRVYGKGSKDIISRWVRAALKDEELQIYRSQGKFDYIMADDVAEGLLRLAESSQSGVVNLGFGKARSIQEVVDILKTHFPNLKTRENPSGIPFEHSQADIQRLKQWTGWHPPQSIEEGIPQLIDYERSLLSQEKKENVPSAVLVTSIGKKMPLLKAVKKAANKLGLFPQVYGADSQPTCIGQYGVDAFWNCPPQTELNLEILLDYCQKHKIKAIIPTRDGELLFFAHYRDKLGEAGVSVMISPLETIEKCLDKNQFAEFLNKERFPGIPTAFQIDEIQALKYVVKERRGAGYGKIGLNLSKDEAEEYSHSLKESLFQPYLEGEEWSIDLYRSKAEGVKGIVARRRELVVHGESQITTTAHFPELEKLGKDLADRLGIYGHAVIQVLVDSSRQFHIIECNPRFGGASTASLAVGLDSFYWFLTEAFGESLQNTPFHRLPAEIRQIRYPQDMMLPVNEQ